jgi:acetyl esterase/lipase
MVAAMTESRGKTLATLRLIAAAVAFAFALLAVIRVPVGFLWKPAIVATEWGHLLWVCPVLLLIGGFEHKRSRAAFALAGVAAVLLLTPLLRALPADGRVPVAVAEAFGEVAPRALVDAPARTGPLVVPDLWMGEDQKVVPTAHEFGAGLTLDLYRRAGTAEFMPVVIMIHGGSWSSGDAQQLPAVNHYLARRGYGVVAINYRKGPENPFPAAANDVRAAVKWVRLQGAEHGLDATKIVLMGRSAGGQLALLVAYADRDPAIRGVVSLYAPTDMAWSWRNPASRWVYDTRPVLRDYLGGSLRERPEAYRAASPLVLVHPGAPPTLLLHGGRDELVSYAQSERLSRRLRELQVNHLLIGIQWGNHAFDANLWGPAGQIYLYVLERFLASVV